MYLSGVQFDLIAFTLVHSLEYMIIQLFGGIEQPPEEMTCPTVLTGQKSVYRFGPKSLVEKAPVQSPSITVWHKNGTEIHSTPEWWIEICNMKRNQHLQIIGDDIWTVGIVPGPVLKQVLRDLFRIEDDDVLSEESRMNYVACADLGLSR